MNFDVALTDPFTASIGATARFPRGGQDWVDVFGDRRSRPTTLDFDLGSMKATQTSDGETQTWDIVRLELDTLCGVTDQQAAGRVGARPCGPGTELVSAAS